MFYMFSTRLSGQLDSFCARTNITGIFMTRSLAVQINNYVSLASRAKNISSTHTMVQNVNLFHPNWKSADDVPEWHILILNASYTVSSKNKNKNKKHKTLLHLGVFKSNIFLHPFNYWIFIHRTFTASPEQSILLYGDKRGSFIWWCGFKSSGKADKTEGYKWTGDATPHICHVKQTLMLTCLCFTDLHWPQLKTCFYSDILRKNCIFLVASHYTIIPASRLSGCF